MLERHTSESYPSGLQRVRDTFRLCMLTFYPSHGVQEPRQPCAVGFDLETDCNWGIRVRKANTGDIPDASEGVTSVMSVDVASSVQQRETVR